MPSGVTEHRDDAPLADPAQSPEAAGDIPSGLPDEDAPESDPMGVPEAQPEGEGDRERGAGAMPGIPNEGEPPASG